MKRFKVLSPGGHTDEAGRNYPKDSIVTTASDLAAKFNAPGSLMFEDLGPAKPVTQVPAVAPASQPANPDPVPPVEGTQGQEKEEGKPTGEQPSKEEEQPPEENAEFGTDVTKNFPLAVEHEFKVFKGAGGWHNVTEPENPKKALNPKALKAGAVEDFIKTLLK